MKEALIVRGEKAAKALLLDEAALQVLASPETLKVLKAFAKEDYPLRVAKKLGWNEQKVYYHVQKLVKAGLLEETRKQPVRGTYARFYKVKTQAYAYLSKPEWEEFKHFQQSPLREFFKEFISEEFNAYIVVGSPEPHGPYKAHARDGHYATDLAFFLGGAAKPPKHFSVKLDVDVKAERLEGENLVVIGGPGTNTLTQEFNEHLPVFFDIKRGGQGFLCSGLKSARTGRHFSDESAGLIAKIRNPYNPEKRVMVLAGYRCIGSKTAVLGLTRFPRLALKKYSSEPFAAVLKGFDLDGDGKVDSVELLE